LSEKKVEKKDKKDKKDKKGKKGSKNEKAKAVGEGQEANPDKYKKPPKFSKRHIFPVLSAMKRKKLILKAQELGYTIIKKEKRYINRPNKGHKYLITQAKRKEETKNLLKKMPKQIKEQREKERKKRIVIKKKRGWELLAPPHGLPSGYQRKYKPNPSWVKKRRQFGP